MHTVQKSRKFTYQLKTDERIGFKEPPNSDYRFSLGFLVGTEDR